MQTCRLSRSGLGLGLYEPIAAPSACSSLNPLLFSRATTGLRVLTIMPCPATKVCTLALGTAALTTGVLTHSLYLQAQMAQLQGQLQDVGALVVSHTGTAARAATDGLVGVDGLQRTYASVAHQVCGCCCASPPNFGQPSIHIQLCCTKPSSGGRLKWTHAAWCSWQLYLTLSWHLHVCRLVQGGRSLSSTQCSPCHAGCRGCSSSSNQVLCRSDWQPSDPAAAAGGPRSCPAGRQRCPAGQGCRRCGCCSTASAGC